MKNKLIKVDLGEGHYAEYEKLTEEQALEKLNYQETVTLKEANDILYSLCDAVNDRARDLPEKTLGTYSYYEGMFRGMDIATKLIYKLDQSSPQVTENKNII